ncbi:MAG TPA: hypothetical protein VFE48_24185 [Methylomirabilota bacterium]|nr:hypothetical protein [Methylomirabilota bacterium]
MFAHIIDACTLVAVGPRAADHTINLVPLTFFHSWEDPRLKSQSCSRRIYIASAFPLAVISSSIASGAPAPKGDDLRVWSGDPTVSPALEAVGAILVR